MRTSTPPKLNPDQRRECSSGLRQRYYGKCFSCCHGDQLYAASGRNAPDTDGYEGFYHLIDMQGDVSHAVLRYIIRDHDAEKFEERKETLRNIEKTINEKWGQGTAALTITDQYRNMAEIIAGCMHLIENAKKACENAGVTPLVLPIRGGTDGAQLSFKGLPCPNLGTGGHGYHGPYEHITAEGMDAACEVALELVKIYAETDSALNGRSDLTVLSALQIFHFSTKWFLLKERIPSSLILHSSADMALRSTERKSASCCRLKGISNTGLPALWDCSER